MTARFAGGLLLLVAVAAEVWAQPTLIGPELQANTSGAFPGYEGPDVSADAAGNFVVVWMDYYDPKGRRFDASGSPVGGEFTVATVTSGVNTYGRDIGVASDPAGGFVVVWGAHGADVYASSDVFAQRYSSSGTAIGGAFHASAGTDEYQENPKIATNAAGDFVVVWEADRLAAPDSGYDVGARAWDATGAPASGDFVVSQTTSGYEGYNGTFEIASDAAGNFVMVWALDNTVFGRRFDPAGTALGGEFQVSDPPNPYAYNSFPGVGTEAGGHFMVAWNDANAVRGRAFDAGGTPLGAQFQVNSLPSSGYGYFGQFKAGPAVAGDGAGNFLVTWLSYGTDGDGFGISGRVFDASGAPRSAEFQVNSSTSGNQLYPQVAALGPGEFVVAWTDQGTYPPRVLAQRLEVPGVSLPLAGKALAIKNTVPDNPERRTGSWSSMDPQIVVGDRNTANDPRCNGDPPGTVKATLRFSSAVSGHDSGTLDLPCENWIAIGPDTTSALLQHGYKYVDHELDQGPCSLVRILSGRSLSATCLGRGATTDFPYDLVVGTDEGIVDVVLTIGTITYCSAFDDTGGKNGSDGRLFKGRNAPAPASCP
jgi:hypothetical protein